MEKVLCLYPGPPVELAVEDVYADLVPPKCGGAHEPPYVALNMVTTLDGKVSLGGKAGPLGSGTDRAVMRNIRSAVDAVLVGAGTVRAEEINLGIPRELSEKRKARGMSEQPLGVILAGTGELPLERKVFRPSAQRVIIVAGEAAPEKTLRRASDGGIRVLRAEGPGVPSPDEVLGLLEKHFGVTSVLLEGGPSINGSFLSSEKVEDLFLTLSPKISRSKEDALTLVSTENREWGATDLQLRSVYLSPRHGELYLRYRRGGSDFR